MIRVTGDATKGEVVMLHMVCEQCERLSDGAPNDAARQVSNHPARTRALAAGWVERFNGAMAMYVCPVCQAKERQENMGEAKQAKPKQLEIKVPIDSVVVELKRAKLVELEQDLDKLQAKKREVSSEYTEKIKEKKEHRKELLEQIDTGMQKVTAPVVERRDDRRACILTVRADTGDVVDERAMTFDERQTNIEDAIRQKNGAKKEAKARTASKPKANGKAKGKRASKPNAAEDSGVVDDDYQPDGASA